jgi:hypothetical protein
MNWKLITVPNPPNWIDKTQQLLHVYLQNLHQHHCFFLRVTSLLDLCVHLKHTLFSTGFAPPSPCVVAPVHISWKNQRAKQGIGL